MDDSGTDAQARPVDAASRHVPVMRDEVLAFLAPALERPGSVYVDATMGMGGHAEAVLQACPHAHVVGIDRDQRALDLAGARLRTYADRVTLVHAVYDEFAAVADTLGLAQIDAALFDLGVSSLQLDEAERGFAYRFDAPLDMRMDAATPTTAAEVLNTYPEADLVRIMREYGEERYAGRIARAIVRERHDAPFDTSARLVDVVRGALPAAAARAPGHPAKRVFQALRIEVNDELAVWRRALPTALDLLRVGGRLAVLSYHSLEDRIAKTTFAAGARNATPQGLPVELAEDAPSLRLLTRGAQQPSAAEVGRNSRAASARLRVVERIRLGNPAHTTHARGPR